MSGNLLAGIVPELRNGAGDLGGGTYQLVAYSGTGHHQDQLVYRLGDSQAALAEDQAMHVSLAVEAESAAERMLRVSIGYADSAGNVNYVEQSIDVPGAWARVSMSLTVPSGMAVRVLYISPISGSPAMQVANSVLAYGSAPVLARSDSTVYTTSQKHSSLVQTVDGISSDVSSLTGTVDAQGTRLATAETNITQNADAIELRATKTEMNDGIATAKSAAIQAAAGAIESWVTSAGGSTSYEQTGDSFTWTTTGLTTGAINAAKSSAIQSAADAIKSWVANAGGSAEYVQTANGFEWATSGLTTAAIADAKAAGTDAQGDLDAYKASNDTAVADAAKTATNYMGYSDGTLTIGDKTGGTFTGTRTTISADGMDILDASGVSRAKFGSTTRLGMLNGDNITFDNNSIQFYLNGSMMAYCTPDKLYSQNSEVANAFNVGDYSLRTGSDGHFILGLRR